MHTVSHLFSLPDALPIEQPNAIDTAFVAMAVPPQDRDPLSVLLPSHPLEWKGSADVVAALNELRTEGVPRTVSAFGQKDPAALGLAEPFSFHANPPQTVLRDLYNQAAIFVSASHE